MKSSSYIYLVLGNIALLFGWLIYYLFRPKLLPGKLEIEFFSISPVVVLSGVLPEFLHTYAFILLTYVALGVMSKTNLYISMAIWLVLESLFEIGQHPLFSHFFSYLETSVFAPQSPARFVTRYFLHGTFDPLDLMAIMIATLAAYYTAHYFQPQDHCHE